MLILDHFDPILVPKAITGEQNYSVGFWLGLQPGQNPVWTTPQGWNTPFFGIFTPLGGSIGTHFGPFCTVLGVLVDPKL